MPYPRILPSFDRIGLEGYPAQSSHRHPLEQNTLYRYAQAPNLKHGKFLCSLVETGFGFEADR
ncbi:hypothetical protein D3C73_1272050 [compost metagenome]